MKARIFVIAALLAPAAALAAVDVEVRSGAVGLEAREEMMRTYRDYNLHLGFAETSGAYLADVGVTLRDASGRTVWSGVSEGPLLFARVPRGRYTVEAQFDGETKKRTVTVAQGPGTIHYIRWDLADVPEPFRASAGR